MRFVEIAAGVDRDTLLGSTRRDAGERVSDAAKWLEGMLADGQWHDSVGLKKLAASQGISERTLQRAASEELRVEHDRRGFPSTSWWRLTVAPAPYVTTVGATGQGQQSPHVKRDSGPSETPVAPVAPSFVDKRDEARLGEEMFPILLANAVKHGHITPAEAEERYALHKFVVGEEKTAA
jgi:hypothetical protein